MLDYLGGNPKRIDIGFTPARSGPQMHFWRDEEEHSCFFTGMIANIADPGGLGYRHR